jgi:hypothetical protein
VKKLLGRLLLALVLLQDLASARANAADTTLDTLIESGQLRLDSWLEPAGDVVVGQEVQLTIEVSTQRWFAGGTTIRHPDVENLVVLRRDDFANNLSRREGAITWVIQRWNLELYPQVAGRFQLPPLELELAVNDASAGVVSGSLKTAPIAFDARIPAVLEKVENWVATPTFILEHSLDRKTAGLVPGDAFNRRISLRATQLTAMMLPPVQATEFPGLPAYEDPPELRDTSNRGEASAERVQNITYVVEQAGQYTLPEQVFYWWDTANNELNSAILPELAIDAGVAAGSDTAEVSDVQRTQLLQGLPRPFWLAIGLALTALLAIYWWRRRSQGVSESRLLRRARRALRRGDGNTAVRLLYRWLNVFRPPPDWYQLRISLNPAGEPEPAGQVDDLLERSYGGRDKSGSPELPVVKPARASWLVRCWRKYGPGPLQLKLNPDDTAAR